LVGDKAAAKVTKPIAVVVVAARDGERGREALRVFALP
jgi:hypothetical protein